MTVDNCFKLLETYKQGMSGKNAKQSKINYEMMKKHILNGKKFASDPRTLALSGNVVEVKTDAKKLKR